jgi:hypothetical protein
MFLYDNSHGVSHQIWQNMSHLLISFNFSNQFLLGRVISVIHCMFLFQLADLLI